jgi:hypothetical protein
MEQAKERDRPACAQAYFKIVSFPRVQTSIPKKTETAETGLKRLDRNVQDQMTKKKTEAVSFLDCRALSFHLQ